MVPPTAKSVVIHGLIRARPCQHLDSNSYKCYTTDIDEVTQVSEVHDIHHGG